MKVGVCVEEVRPGFGESKAENVVVCVTADHDDAWNVPPAHRSHMFDDPHAYELVEAGGLVVSINEKDVDPSAEIANAQCQGFVR